MIVDVVLSCTGIGKLGEACGNLRQREFGRCVKNTTEGVLRMGLSLMVTGIAITAISSLDRELASAVHLKRLQYYIDEKRLKDAGFASGAFDRDDGVRAYSADFVEHFCWSVGTKINKVKNLAFNETSCFESVFQQKDDIFNKILQAPQKQAFGIGTYCLKLFGDSQQRINECSQFLFATPTGNTILGRLLS